MTTETTMTATRMNFPSSYTEGLFGALKELQAAHPDHHIEYLYGDGYAATSDLPANAVIVGYWGKAGKGLSRATFYYVQPTA